VNGGGFLRVSISAPGYFPAERRIRPGYHGYRVVDDVTLISADTLGNTIALGASAPQLAAASVQQDAGGSRQTKVYFPSGTSASMTTTSGSTQLQSMVVRATEYSVGDRGQTALPAELPASAAYMFAVELSADEALSAGAEHVEFDRPVSVYLDNYRNLPIGLDVLTGFLDRSRGSWIPSDAGRIIKVLGNDAGFAVLDGDGDGEPDSPSTLAALGISDEERQVIASSRDTGSSFWRVRVSHFSGFTCTFGMTEPGCGEGGPCPTDLSPDRPYVDHSDTDCNSAVGGSIIECESQVLRESLPVIGTPFTLNYRSAYAPGFTADRTLIVPLVADKVRTRLDGAVARVEIAGRNLVRGLGRDELYPFASVPIVWDGLDAFGRRMNGVQKAHVTVEHFYSLSLTTKVQGSRLGMLPEGSEHVPGDQSTSQYRLQWEFDVDIGATNASQRAFGGWSLSPQHLFDANDGTLYLGTGERVATRELGSTVLRETAYKDPEALMDFTFSPDGRLYFVGGPGYRVLSADPKGMELPVPYAYSATTGLRTGEEGIPALSAWGTGGSVRQISFGPDGSLYIAELNESRIRRVSPDGKIWTFAGKLCTSSSGALLGCQEHSGDGGPAIAAGLHYPEGVVAGPDGRVFIADTRNNVIRVVDIDGTINTFAGNGLTVPKRDRSQEGVLATKAAIPAPSTLHLGPDGTLYCLLKDNAELVRITRDGILHYATGPTRDDLGEIQEGEISSAQPFAVQAFDVTPAGSVMILDVNPYVSDGTVFPSAQRIREVDPFGIARTIAGGAQTTTHGTDVTRPALKSNLYFTNWLSLTPKDEPVSWGLNQQITELDFFRLQKIQPPALAGCAATVPAPSGEKLFCFDANGRHLSTLQARTLAVLEAFEYVDGLLSAVTDASGNRTTITRDLGAGTVTIRGAFGHTSVLMKDANGFAASLQDATGAVTTIHHDDQGLLTAVTDPEGRQHGFSYDAEGRLLEDVDPAGAHQVLSRAGSTVTRTSGAGRITVYDVDHTDWDGRITTTTSPDQTQVIAERRPDQVLRTTMPDGTLVTRNLEPDPRLGMNAPFVQSESVKLPSGLTRNTSTARDVSVASDGRVTSSVESVTINGATSTYTYAAGADNSASYVTTSPVGRQRTTTLDELGRVRSVSIPGFLPTRRRPDLC
jgi:YD repeat-containing protein